MNFDGMGRVINILMIEDNPGDVRLTKEALKGFKLANTISVTRDGVEGMQFLRREGEFADAPRPNLILLDLNLPKKNGIKVLEEIKTDPKLKQIPVLVLTSSSAEKDVSEAYSKHANCYITKPISFDEFIKVVSTIKDFWFSLATLPSDET